MRTTVRTEDERFQVEIRSNVSSLPVGRELGWVLDCDDSRAPYWYTLPEAEARVRELGYRDIGARVF
jgi:hypothetical protein